MQMMQRLIIRVGYSLMIVMMMIAQNGFAAWQSTSPPPQETMQKVNDYWRGKSLRLHAGDILYHIGNLAAHDTLKTKQYLDDSSAWAKRVKSELIHELKSARINPDDQAAGQVFFKLCEEDECYQDAREALEESVLEVLRLREDPSRRSPLWSYIDHIFMAGPIISQLGREAFDRGDIISAQEHFSGLQGLFDGLKTGTDVFYNRNSCLTRHDAQACDAQEACLRNKANSPLYDTDDNLWYRDRYRISACFRNASGEKLYWSRGNGWVIAALPRILAHLPRPASGLSTFRDAYEDIFRDMAQALKQRQQPDGFWYPSLDDPDDFGGPETSGTALFTYAIAWGINQGLLNADTYTPVVVKAWDAMVRVVDDNGKLLYVQQSADEACDKMCPEQTNAFNGRCECECRKETFFREQTDPYGVGAFLLAGSEVAKLDVQWVRPCTEGNGCIKVNFQLASADSVPGYLTDHGAKFDDRGNGFTYGWNASHTDYSRKRKLNKDQRLDTLILFHRDGVWEIELKNGDYEVIVSIGDAKFSDGLYTIDVEGINYWNEVILQANVFLSDIKQVRVSDGLLTVSQGELGEKDTRINYLHILPITNPPESKVYQAEDAFEIRGGAKVESNHNGFNGSGFVNFPRDNGSIEWRDVDGGRGGSIDLVLRYALGASARRTCDLVINGEPQSIIFEPTGSWSQWANVMERVTLNRGIENRIHVSSTGEDCGNIDQLLVIQ